MSFRRASEATISLKKEGSGGEGGREREGEKGREGRREGRSIN